MRRIFYNVIGNLLIPSSVQARFPWYIKLFGGRQVARNLHFLSMIAFVLFIIVHTALVLIVYFPDNIRNIVLGSEQANLGPACAIAVIALLVVVAIYLKQPVVSGSAERFSLDVFFHRVSMREGVDLLVAAQHARTVAAVLSEAVSDGQLDHLRTQLPPDLVQLFMVQYV